MNRYRRYRHIRQKWVYGVEKAELEDYFYLQGGECAICMKPFGFHDRNMHIDHDHKTGEVRGLLCAACNMLLGHAKDNPLILFKAISYLQDPPIPQFKKYQKLLK